MISPATLPSCLPLLAGSGPQGAVRAVAIPPPQLVRSTLANPECVRVLRAVGPPVRPKTSCPRAASSFHPAFWRVDRIDSCLLIYTHLLTRPRTPCIAPRVPCANPPLPDLACLPVHLLYFAPQREFSSRTAWRVPAGREKQRKPEGGESKASPFPTWPLHDIRAAKPRVSIS